VNPKLSIVSDARRSKLPFKESDGKSRSFERFLLFLSWICAVHLLSIVSDVSGQLERLFLCSWINKMDDERCKIHEIPSEDASVLPDVVLNIPKLRVSSINLEVNNLNAHLDVHARVCKDLVQLNAGVDVTIEKVKLEIKDVEAEAYLRVKSDNVRKVVEETLLTLREKPEILHYLLRDVSQLTHTVATDLGQTVIPSLGENVVKPVAQDVIPSLGENVVKPVAQDVIPSLGENVVKPVAQDVVKPVARDVIPSLGENVVKPVARDVVPLVNDVEDAIASISGQSDIATINARAIYDDKEFDRCDLEDNGGFTSTITSTAKNAVYNCTGKILNIFGLRNAIREILATM
jgi:hypothetical protein